MAKRVSVGILLYRFRDEALQVFIVHPGGPLWAKRDAGAWSIPKGEVDPGVNDPEILRAEARREFEEETGQVLPDGEWLPLTPVRLASGKTILAWAIEGTIDANELQSNQFTMEWPPRSGRLASFPEVDRGAWLSPDSAREKLNRAQVAFVDELILKLAG